MTLGKATPGRGHPKALKSDPWGLRPNTVLEGTLALKTLEAQKSPFRHFFWPTARRGPTPPPGGGRCPFQKSNMELFIKHFQVYFFEQICFIFLFIYYFILFIFSKSKKAWK